MNETINEETESQKKRKEYMRTYMNKRYYANIELSRAYLKSSKCKNVNNLDATELKKYGCHLADVHKLRQILKVLPNDICNEIFNEYTFENAEPTVPARPPSTNMIIKLKQ